MRVTHSALGLHEPGNPRSGPKATKPSNRVGYSGQGLMVTPAVENGVRATRWEPTGHRKVEKALSMRPRVEVPLSQRLQGRAGAHTVEAEKGNLWKDAA